MKLTDEQIEEIYKSFEGWVDLYEIVPQTNEILQILGYEDRFRYHTESEPKIVRHFLTELCGEEDDD